jgi:hypothetical protein
MKYLNDKQTIEDISVMVLKESGVKISDKKFSDIIEIITNIDEYPANMSFKTKLLVTQKIIQAFLLGLE